MTTQAYVRLTGFSYIMKQSDCTVLIYCLKQFIYDKMPRNAY